MKTVVLKNCNGKYYFIYDDITYVYLANELNIALNKLKEKLIVPFTIEFDGYTKIEIAETVSCLLEKGIKVNFNKLNNFYTATFTALKNEIEVIKIESMSWLYGNRNDINPYTILDLNDKKILLEVTKDYAKQNEGNYFFLTDDLTKEELKIFKDYYTLIEYDYLCKIDNDYHKIDSKLKLIKKLFTNQKS